MGGSSVTMKKPSRVVLVALWAVFLLRAQESAASKPASRPVPVTPAEKVAAIEVEYSDAMDAFQKLYQETKPESRDNLFETKYPKASTWLPIMFEIAKANPKD